MAKTPTVQQILIAVSDKTPETYMLISGIDSDVSGNFSITDSMKTAKPSIIAMPRPHFSPDSTGSKNISRVNEDRMKQGMKTLIK